MSNLLVATLAEIYAEVACIEAMKAENSQRPESQPYGEKHFYDRADRLTYLAEVARNLPNS